MPIVMIFSVMVELNLLYHFLSDIPWIRRVIVPSADKIGIGPIMAVREPSSHICHVPSCATNGDANRKARSLER